MRFMRLADHIEMVPISELKPYEKNPRRNDAAVPEVQYSIEKFGFLIPMVIDKNNVVVAGHTRLKAAERLGYKEVPCIIADYLTEKQIKAFRIADNKVSEKSTWDYDLLPDEMMDVASDLELDIDLDKLGFSDFMTFIKEDSEDETGDTQEPKFQMFHSRMSENRVESAPKEPESVKPSNERWLEKGLDYTKQMMETKRIIIEYTDDDVEFLQDLFMVDQLRQLIKAEDLRKKYEG